VPNERLRDALLRNGLTPDQVAQAIKVDPKTVERWITKGRAPYPKHRRAIAAMVRETENYLWPDAIDPNRKTEIAQSEVVEIFPHRNSIPADLWDRLLEDTKEHIEVLSLAALFLVERPSFAKQIKRKARDGVVIRMLFGDPAGDEATRRNDEEQLHPGTMSARIRNALAFVRPLDGVERVNIRLHTTTLYNSVFRFDDEMIVNTHVYGFPGAHAPALHLRRLSAGDLFETYSESLETVWAAATPLTW
jgi:hypothetical protein